MESHTVLSGETNDAEIRIHLKTIICIASVSFGYMAQVAGIVGASVLSRYMGELVGQSSQTVWFASIITILTVALCPPINQAADYWGRKWLLVTTSSGGIVGCIIISRAEKFSVLLAGFGILGLNYGSQSLLMAIVSEVLPRRHRPWGQVATSAAASIGGIGGILMGGGLLRNGNIENCRIYWYVMAGIFGISTICCAVGYDPPPRENQLLLKTTEKLRCLDWIGFFLFAPGLAIFSTALAWSKNPYPWTDAHVIGPFVVGVSMIILFIVYEWRFKKDGILHSGLWQHRNFGLSLFIIFVEGLAFLAANSYFAMEVTILYGDNLLVAGANFGMMFVSGFISAGPFGFWSTRRKTVREPIVVGCISLLVFFVLMSTVKSDTPRAALWIYPFFAGAGLGCIIPISMAAAQLATPPELIAIASALMVSVRSLGGAISLTIDNAIFISSLEKELPAKISAATLPLGLPVSSLPSLIEALSSGSPEAISRVPGVTSEIVQAGGAALKEAYVLTFRNVWVTSVAFCALLTVSSCFLKEQREEFNDNIEAPTERRLIMTQAEAKRASSSDVQSVGQRPSEKMIDQHKEIINV